MKLSIPPLSQRDPKWKDKKLGGGGSIGLYGCLLVCHSMYQIYCGREDMAPDVLNEVFKTNNCFDGNNLNFYAIGKVWGDFKAVEYYECNDIPCDLGKIDNYLTKKQPVIAKVDFDMNPSTKGDWHFVLIIGKTEDGHYIINDPWSGETYFFDAKYGDPAKGIYGLRIYEGVPKESANTQDTINDLTERLASCNSANAEKFAECARLIKDLADQERDNNDLANQLNTARGERDTALWERDRLILKLQDANAQIEGFQKDITTYKEEIKGLKNDLVASQAGNLLGIGLIDFIRLKFFTRR